MGQLKEHRHQRTGNLFPLATRFRLAELRSADAYRCSDNLKILKELIISNEGMYPGIKHWFGDKVVSGLRTSQRVAYVAFEDERPIASAVLKLGTNAKFCHLRIREDFRDMALGQMFFTQMTLEARRYAKDIHFTLPESLWSEKSGFFESFGFSTAGRAPVQYRRGNTELLCSASVASVWSAALAKVPALLAKFTSREGPLKNHIVISIKPKYADKILVGIKCLEIRKRFSSKWTGYRAVLYSSSPVSALVGEATIGSVSSGHPGEVWSRFESGLGCSREEFRAYTESSDHVSVIELRDVTAYKEPLRLNQLSEALDDTLRPPLSFCSLKLSEESPWTKAASIASLVNAGFSGSLESSGA
jgi:predicted transcriptional regulator